MRSKKQNIEIKFSDGTVSNIDEKVHRLILNYQREIQDQRKALPPFYDLAKCINEIGSELIDFYNFLLSYRHLSKSLFQDLFVLFIHEMKTEGTFWSLAQPMG